MTTLALPRTTLPTATQARPITLATTVRQSLTMAWRGLLKVRRNPEQLLDVTAQPIIFTLMFTYLFGGAVSGSVHAYLPVIVPGILVQTILTASAVTGVQLREDMDKGVYDRFRSLPIARIAPLAGALIADLTRYLIASTITIAMGLLLGWRPQSVTGTIAAVLLVVLCAWAISWIFAYLGVIGRSASAVQGQAMIVLFPLTFMSNALVNPDTMPSGFATFVRINPVSHLVSAARALASGANGTEDVALALGGAALIVAVFAPLAVRAYMRKA